MSVAKSVRVDVQSDTLVLNFEMRARDNSQYRGNNATSSGGSTSVLLRRLRSDVSAILTPRRTIYISQVLSNGRPKNLVFPMELSPPPAFPKIRGCLQGMHPTYTPTSSGSKSPSQQTGSPLSQVGGGIAELVYAADSMRMKRSSQYIGKKGME